MGRLHLTLPVAAACMVLASVILCAPVVIEAAQITVPGNYATIQAAITAALPGDTVVVAPGTYDGPITLKDGVDLRGSETARTILSLSGSSGPVMTADGDVTVTISSFTFQNAAIGIRVTGDPAAVAITNNVFHLGNAGAAVVVSGSPGVSIENNTFSGNGTAVSRDDDIILLNNIFANNATAIADSSILSANTAYNAFFNNTTDGPVGTNEVTGDPLFVDPAKQDFHLAEGSPCIDSGDPALTDGIDDTWADIGAYGGPNADPTPFPVQGLAVVATTGASIDLSWQPNKSYLVTNTLNPGGYKLYYGYASGNYNGTDAFSGTEPSPIDVGPDAFFSLPDLTPPASLVPAAPILNQLVPGNGSLEVAWSGVADATGYKIHYGELSTGQVTHNVGKVTSYTISGLTNGQPYHVAVSSYAPATYYLAVRAYDSMFVNESALSGEVPAALTTLLESGLSEQLTDYPDALAPYPALPNKGGGCFIATAAYGSPSAPEVQVLRNFRDRYLLTTEIGKRIVEWYYRNSPAAAELLNAHPAFKPSVRAMLLPTVAAAGILTGMWTLYTAGVVLLLGSAFVFVLKRKGTGGKRGVR